MLKYIIQKRKTTEISYSLIILIIYISYLMVPIIPAYLPQVLKYTIYVIVIGGSIFATIERDRDEIIGLIVTVVNIILLSIMIYFGIWVNKAEFSSYFLQKILFWLGLIILPQFNRLEKEETRILVNVLTILLFFTIITTIVGNIQNPNASRELATTTKEIRYLRHNIGGYQFVYGLTILLPYIIYHYRKQTGLKKILAFFTIVSITTVCILTEYTFAIIISFFVLVVEIGNKKQRKGLYILLLLLLLLFLYLFRYQIAEFLISVKEFCDTQGLPSIAERIENIRHIFLGNDPEGDAEMRISKYLRSLSIFLKSPLIGNIGNSEQVGGHSELLDILGGSGIIGFVLFCILIGKHYFKNIYVYKNTGFFWPAFESFIVFIIIASINTVLTSPFIGVCLFLGPRVMYSINEKLSETKVTISGSKYLR